MEILIICVLIGLIPAAIANSKGRNFFLWWLYGAALFIVALVHSLVLKDEAKEREAKLRDAALTAALVHASGGSAIDVRACPYCAETIKRAAKVCRFCGRDVPEDIAPETVAPHQQGESAITFDGTQYVYKGYKYDRREDAEAYAKKYD